MTAAVRARRARLTAAKANPGVTHWDLTFDVSGGGQAAKLAGRRPLDGGVRFQRLRASRLDEAPHRNHNGFELHGASYADYDHA